jgi:cytochrome c
MAPGGSLSYIHGESHGSPRAAGDAAGSGTFPGARMRRIFLPSVASALLLAACGGAGAHGGPAVAEPAARADDAAPAAQLALGEQVFDRLCSACHTMDAPPGAAPPMTHVARHYREAFADRNEGVEHMTAFIRAPSAERSVLPARARERWGLMPPLILPEAELRAVAEYVWQLPAPGRGMGGHQHGASD